MLVLREGNLRELPITSGHIVLDDNLLACSEKHIRSVFDMLKLKKSAQYSPEVWNQDCFVRGM